MRLAKKTVGVSAPPRSPPSLVRPRWDFSHLDPTSYCISIFIFINFDKCYISARVRLVALWMATTILIRSGFKRDMGCLFVRGGGGGVFFPFLYFQLQYCYFWTMKKNRKVQLSFDRSYLHLIIIVLTWLVTISIHSSLAIACNSSRLDIVRLSYLLSAPVSRLETHVSCPMWLGI